MSKGPGSGRPPAPPVRPEVAQGRSAIAKLEARIAELNRLQPGAIENRKDPIIETLSQGIDAALREVFGADTPDYQRFSAAKNIDRAPFLLNGTPMALVRNGLEQGKAVGVSLLEEAIALLQERIAEGAPLAAAAPVRAEPATPAAEPPKPAAAPAAPPTIKPAAAEAPAAAPSILKAADAPAPAKAPPAPAAPATAAAAAPGTRDVLVIHGNDTVASGEIARFLRKAEFNAIILHEQGGEALTDIERLERHGSAGFAVVLLPPEEETNPQAGGARPARGRQAVTAELFYFVGKLGRARVCALSTKEGDEPAVTGIGYAHYDRYEGWQKLLLKALEDAGYAIDWAKALR